MILNYKSSALNYERLKSYHYLHWSSLTNAYGCIVNINYKLIFWNCQAPHMENHTYFSSTYAFVKARSRLICCTNHYSKLSTYIHMWYVLSIQIFICVDMAFIFQKPLWHHLTAGALAFRGKSGKTMVGFVLSYGSKIFFFKRPSIALVLAWLKFITAPLNFI